MTFFSTHLLELGEHDDDGGVVFPEHPPEIVSGVVQRALSGDVSGSVPVTVDQTRVYVVRALDVPLGLQAHSGALVGQDVDQSVFVLVAGQVRGDESRRVGFDVGEFLELELHAGDVVYLGLHELLDVRVEVARGHLGVAADHRLEEGVVDEDVLVLRLDHVVALRPETGHVAVDVDHLLVPDALEHRVDDDETAGATDACAAVHHQRTTLGWVQSFHTT